ncbi:sine oculis-binding protein homolog isoform X1 [Haliotis cracherodii]|uniref:sine oculis-binding protein homolog isoform X1 n=2 Tax=Haliotis cracherodii TaxID=6455 RepID=UPI0039EB682B
MDKNYEEPESVAEDLPVKIKEEPQDDIKDYAETTMNELLGWYGYDKVSSSETEQLNLGRYRPEDSMDDGDVCDGDSLDGSESGLMTPEEGESGRLSAANSESSLAAQHRNLVSALNRRQESGTPGLSDSSSPSSFIVCAWCQKTGMKLFTLKSSTGLKAFCSEICFTQCRRASFKKNKVCDWCKHVRHTVNYVDFQDGDQQLQFCSSKCLNQYKMNIFCRETQEHLKQMQQIGEDSEDSPSPTIHDKQILITPDLWLSKKQDQARGIKREDKGDDDGEVSVRGEKNSTLSKSFLSSRKFETSSGADRFAKDRERLRRAIRESREAARSCSPPRSTRQSSPKAPLPGASGFPQWMPPPHLMGGLAPGMASLGMFNPMMFGGLFGNPSERPPLLTPDAGGSSKHRDRDRSQSTSGAPLSLSSPETSPSSTSTTPNLPRATSSAAEPNMRSVSSHNPAPPLGPGLPRGNFGAGLFPFGGAPGALPPMFPGDPGMGNMCPPFFNPIGPGQLPHPGMPPPPAGNGVPPVTVMVPFPVVLPLPIPIPVPLPISMEKLMKFFAEKQAESNAPSPDTKVGTSADEVRDTVSPQSSTPLSSRVHFPRENTHRRVTVSRDSASSGCIDCASCKQPDRQRSESAEPAITQRKDIKPSFMIDSHILKRSLTPTTARTLDLTKRPKLDLKSNQTGAIDLSKDSCVSSDSEVMGKENHRVFTVKDRPPSESSKTDAEDSEVDTGLKVPRIHIVSTAGEPPLASQQLPLPPTDHAYSLRRSLILDAPNVPKQQKNTYQERPYVRSVPRDMIEAARRRCLRARVRTK